MLLWFTHQFLSVQDVHIYTQNVNVALVCHQSDRQLVHGVFNIYELSCVFISPTYACSQRSVFWKLTAVACRKRAFCDGCKFHCAKSGSTLCHSKCVVLCSKTCVWGTNNVVYVVAACKIECRVTNCGRDVHTLRALALPYFRQSRLRRVLIYQLFKCCRI
jgi:hypothetical protein